MIRLTLCSAIILLFHVVLCHTASSTSVEVYAETGCNENECLVTLFTDIEADAEGSLRSAGVRLAYPSTKLVFATAYGNHHDWFLGVAGSMQPYPAISQAVAPEIVFLLTRIDVSTPGTGVSGSRIKLGTARFERIPGANQPEAAEFELLEGNLPPFDDFVTVTGKQLDGLISYLPVTVAPLDQLHLAGVIRILQLLSAQSTDIVVRPAEFDCNGDGVVSIAEAIHLLTEISE